MWNLILFKNTVKMIFCDQKVCFLSYNPWGCGIDNDLVSEFELRQIDSEWVSQMLKQIVNRNGNWKVDYAIKRTLHI